MWKVPTKHWSDPRCESLWFHCNTCEWLIYVIINGKHCFHFFFFIWTAIAVSHILRSYRPLAHVFSSPEWLQHRMCSSCNRSRTCSSMHIKLALLQVTSGMAAVDNKILSKENLIDGNFKTYEFKTILKITLYKSICKCSFEGAIFYQLLCIAQK